jgi:hypothetical protein
VWDGSGTAQFLDRRDAASIAQPCIDDHQVWSASKGGGHGISLGGLEGANLVAHLFEHLGKQHADHDVVLHHEDAGCCHWFTSPPALPSSTQISM